MEKPFSHGHVPSYQSGNRWKNPSHMDASLPINQATGGKTLLTWTRPFLSIRQPVEKPFSHGRVPSYQSSEFEHPIQKGRSSPYPSAVSQELRMDEEVTKAEPTCRS